ncbi:MAG: DinB family protein [Gemmatimonadetes bacterium]|nr:DinB family protein [Gemmatimonadota bacterium]
MRVIPVVMLLGLPSFGLAQAPARLALIDDWKHQRTHLLAVIDSATPGMLGFRSTPGVRTFAEQIDHIAGAAAFIVSRAVAGTPLPAGIAGDTARYLHDKAALRTQAAKYLDYVIATLESVSEADLSQDRQMFGGTMPRWRWNLTALQHSAWTLGQVVPYLRMNGRVPPAFTPF